jgi:cell wall assembly regulator SMI1
MKQLLYKLDSVLKVKNVGLYEKLAAPLTDNSITQLSAEVKFPLPDEVKELFKWKNGTILTENVALGSFWLMPLNTFADIEGSVQYYKNAMTIIEFRKIIFLFSTVAVANELLLILTLHLIHF